jgi:hypothetical protein
VGYLRPIKQWNDGKQAEYALRKTYRPDSVNAGVNVTVVAKPRVAAVESVPPEGISELQEESPPQQAETVSR